MYLHAQYFEANNESACEVTMYKANMVVIDSMITNNAVLMPLDLMGLGKQQVLGLQRIILIIPKFILSHFHIRYGQNLNFNVSSLTLTGRLKINGAIQKGWLMV